MEIKRPGHTLRRTKKCSILAGKHKKDTSTWETEAQTKNNIKTGLVKML